MFVEVQPTAVLTRGADTPQERADTAQILKRCGCRYVRYESRSDGAFTALGFLTEAINVVPL